MSKVLGIRLEETELQLLEAAEKQARRPGDRGGLSAWVRRVVLREAQAILGGDAQKKTAS